MIIAEFGRSGSGGRGGGGSTACRAGNDISQSSAAGVTCHHPV